MRKRQNDATVPEDVCVSTRLGVRDRSIIGKVKSKGRRDLPDAIGSGRKAMGRKYCMQQECGRQDVLTDARPPNVLDRKVAEADWWVKLNAPIPFV